MRIFYLISFIILFACMGCQWHLKSTDADHVGQSGAIQRYDRIESLYLTTGDIAALQQMNTTYPMETRMLIEDVLQLGQVNDADINTKFLYFFQDSTLQQMLIDVEAQYADIEDVNQELSEAFRHLQQVLPDMEIPNVYTQIGSFDQSIIVGHQSLGISLDKYLGADYPFYKDHYTEQQREMMVREMIVPDCLSFYILSRYPAPTDNPQERFRHMGDIQWVVNHLLGRQVFDNEHVAATEQYMMEHPSTTLLQLLQRK